MRYTPFQPTLSQTGLDTFGLSLAWQAPCRRLDNAVHAYLQIKTEKPTPYPVMPDATQAIFMSTEGAMIAGAQSQAAELQLLQAGEYFGIWFRPGALRYFYDLNVSVLSNQFVAIADFAQGELLNLHANIYRRHDFAERVACCESWLLHRYAYKSPSSFDHALSLIYQSQGNQRIDQLATMLGWSSRHLNRQFLQHTGLTTKTFSRIIRAQHTCQHLYTKRTHGCHLALELGYYDQAHQIKDFRQFFNSAPGPFFRQFMSDFYNQ